MLGLFYFHTLYSIPEEDYKAELSSLPGSDDLYADLADLASPAAGSLKNSTYSVPSST